MVDVGAAFEQTLKQRGLELKIPIFDPHTEERVQNIDAIVVGAGGIGGIGSAVKEEVCDEHAIGRVAITKGPAKDRIMSGGFVVRQVLSMIRTHELVEGVIRC